MSDPQTQSPEEPEEPEETGAPVPRDLPDQQARDGEDPADEARAARARIRKQPEHTADADQGPAPDEPSG